ncbi:thiamine-phosphate kinase [Candidatus Moduliflexota bacterium]
MNTGKGPRGLEISGEEGILRYLEKRHGRGRTKGVALGIGDDGAELVVPGGRVLATTDLMIEGVHFRLTGTSVEDLGFKLAAVNVSDIAAMGGLPLYALLSMSLPAALDFDFVRRLSKGLKRAGRKYGMELVGGDTTVSPGGVFLNLTLLGRPAGPRSLTRSAARQGDDIYVTGHLGASVLGLAALDLGEEKRRASHLRGVTARHLRPDPPAAWGAALARRELCTAAIDISDGLSTDLGRLCRASSAGAEIFTADLPIRRGTVLAASALDRNAVEAALHGGEEYELLFTVDPSKAGAMKRLARRMKVAVTPIGSVTGGRRISQIGRGGERFPLEPAGWRHF